MVHNSWLRPKTSTGLPTANNDSSIYTSAPPQQLPTRRSTQEFFSRPSLSDTVAARSTGDFVGARPKAREFHETRIKVVVEEVRSVAAAMVRKALQGSRDMRPLEEFTPIEPAMDYASPADSVRPPSSHIGRSRQRESTITRPLTRLRSFRDRARRGAVSLRSGKSFGAPVAEILRADQPVTYNGPPLFLHQVLPGSAARASAAEHNKSQQNLIRTDTMMTRSRGYRGPDKGEKGYDEVTECRPPSMGSAKLIDPVKYLPTEISSIILAYLDDPSLLRAQQVSHAWQEVACSSAVWRSAFLGQYCRRPSNTLPYIQMGGQGLGNTGYSQQKWQKMSKARMEIERNWRRRQPKAIYFSGHTDSVYCCQFDEDKIITGSRDRTVRVWDLNYPYKCRKVIGGPAARPTLPSSDAVLDVHPTNTVWNEPSVNGTLEGDAIFHVPSDYHSASILCLQFDQEIMVTGSSDSTCIVWDIKTYEPIMRLRHHSAGVLDVCFDETYIISCSKDSTICVWSRATGELIKALSGHKGPVNAVQLRKIGGRKLLVSASGDSFSKLWDLERLEEVKKFESQDRGLAAVEYSDDGRYVLAGGNDQVIYKYDVATSNCILRYQGHTNLVRSLFLDSANGRVLSGSYDQGIRVFDFATGEEMGVYDNWTTSWILAAKSDYRRIVATSQDGRALLMDFGWGIEGVDLLKGCNGGL